MNSLDHNFNQGDGYLQPSDIHAEQAIIGACFRNGEHLTRAATKMSAKDFYDPNHQVVFDAMVGLKKEGKQADLVTVNDALKKSGANVDSAYVLSIIKNTPMLPNIENYVSIVREKAVFRRLLQTMGDLSEKAYNPQGLSANAILNEGISELKEIGRSAISSTARTKRMTDHLSDSMARLNSRIGDEGNADIFKTGIGGYDAALVGIERSEFVCVGGRPAQGKTSLMLNIIQNIASQYKVPSIIFSMEMPGAQLMDRLICASAGVNARKFREGSVSTDELRRINNAAAVLEQLPIIFDEAMGLTPNLVEDKLKRYEDEFGQLGVVGLDYLQLMDSDYGERDKTGKLIEITREVKKQAVNHNVGMIALSQMNRSLDNRIERDPMEKPVQKDLLNAGSIEADANTVVFVHRPETYFPNETKLKGYAELVCAKALSGEPGIIPLEFIGQNTKYVTGNPNKLEQQKKALQDFADSKNNISPRFNN